MSADHDPRFAELLPAHAIGALDGEERRDLEAHLEGCASCRAALAAWQREGEALAFSVPAIPPAATTRVRLLREIEHTPQAGPTAFREPLRVGASRWTGAGWWAAAAALALAVWVGAGQRALRRENARLAAESTAIAARLEQVSNELDGARGELARLRLAAQILSTPDLRPVVLAGLAEAPAAVAHSFVNPQQHRALFQAYKLAAAPAGKTYQLWFIADGKPVSAGVFDVDAEGRAQLVVEGVAPLERIQAWAVTVEPAGGVPQPTGTMVLKG